jgi:hypothetical protein
MRQMMLKTKTPATRWSRWGFLSDLVAGAGFEPTLPEHIANDNRTWMEDGLALAA